MLEPILKIHWERFRAPLTLDIPTASLLVKPYSAAPISDLVLLSDGCANTNYKVIFKNSDHPVVIRFYVRDKFSISYETTIHRWVRDSIPVPKHLYADDTCKLYSHPFVIMECVEGKLMRDVVISREENAISECAFEAGKYLSILRKMTFSKGGFFQLSDTTPSVNIPLLEDKLIRAFNKDEEYQPFIKTLLAEKNVKDSLGNELHHAVNKLVDNYASLLPEINDANLTHGDYDPANILVKQVKDRWEIAAILDWEFAFAGTYLLDMGTMLRYAHKLPPCYENRFIAGIKAFSTPLPKEWKIQAKLMDLICLLQLAYYNPLSERPNTNRDVVELIAYTVSSWKS